MGNRAVITTPQRKVGLYVHWNGGRDTIEPLRVVSSNNQIKI